MSNKIATNKLSPKQPINPLGGVTQNDMKTAEEILKNTLGDIRYGLNGNEMNNQIIHAMEMYLLQSSLPSPSLPSDEEGLMREIFGEHYLKLIEVKYSSPAQYNDLTGGTILAINYFKEKLSVYSTRIAEMEREMKGLTEALKGELVLNDLLRDGHFKNKDGMPIVKYIDKPNKGDVAYIRHDAMVKKINSIIKSTTTP